MGLFRSMSDLLSRSRRPAGPAGSFGMPAIVFLTGAGVLVIEVAAVRILAPYYGNTIYTVSSVLSVVLAALSFGYYFGGRLADRYPTEKVFYGMILLSGVSTLVLQLLNQWLLPVIQRGFSTASGPLAASVVLFFLPNLFLGTLSPYAIKLQEKRLAGQGIGSISGAIYFWSTVGGIFGSLSAGFVLIPRFGISRIILAVAAVLTLLGSVPLARSALRRKYFAPMVIAIIVYFVSAAAVTSLAVGPNLYERDGVYQKITISDGEYRGRPARFLKQDRTASAAMFLDSDELVYDYTKYYSLYRLFKPDLRRALFIGGGAYSMPKALLAEQPAAEIEVSEIEPSLFELGRKYFRVPDDPRLTNLVGDGRRLLLDSGRKYDLIFSDVYASPYYIPLHFVTREFFQIARERLTDGGIFAANIVGNLSLQPPSLVRSEMKTFREAFPNSYFFAVRSPAWPKMQNVIFLGCNSDQRPDLGAFAAGHSGDEILGSLDRKLIDADSFDLAAVPVLTDDFSPVEYLTAETLRRENAAPAEE